MLPLKFFSDPAFTVASLGVGLVFFAMMGSVFAFTQFLQFAHGYSALEAGAAMLPLALGLVIGSGASNKLVGRVGRTRVIAGGLVGVAAVLSTRCCGPRDGPGLLALVTFGLALSMGAAMAPATDSVMGAVPEAKAGVGSAMSDVTRQVGGALGVAVIGSLIGSAYSRRHGGRAGPGGRVRRGRSCRGRAARRHGGRGLAASAGRRSPTRSDRPHRGRGGGAGRRGAGGREAAARSPSRRRPCRRDPGEVAHNVTCT